MESAPVNPPARLQVEADMAALADIRRFVGAMGAQLGARGDALTELVCAVDEAATNIVMHGYRGAAGLIVVEVTREDASLVVRLTDWAEPYDPTAAPPPEPAISPLDRECGGLGISFMRQWADRLTYETAPDGANRLTLVKLFRTWHA